MLDSIGDGNESQALEVAGGETTYGVAPCLRSIDKRMPKIKTRANPLRLDSGRGRGVYEIGTAHGVRRYVYAIVYDRLLNTPRRETQGNAKITGDLLLKTKRVDTKMCMT